MLIAENNTVLASVFYVFRNFCLTKKYTKQLTSIRANLVSIKNLKIWFYTNFSQIVRDIYNTLKLMKRELGWSFNGTNQNIPFYVKNHLAMFDFFNRPHFFVIVRKTKMNFMRPEKYYILPTKRRNLYCAISITFRHIAKFGKHSKHQFFKKNCSY